MLAMVPSWARKSPTMVDEELAMDIAPMDGKAKYPQVCVAMEQLGRHYYLVPQKQEGPLDHEDKKALGTLVSPIEGDNHGLRSITIHTSRNTDTCVKVTRPITDDPAPCMTTRRFAMVRKVMEWCC